MAAQDTRTRLRALLDSGDARRWRVAAKLSRAALGRRLGVTERAVHRWETGAAFPNEMHAEDYAALLAEIQPGAVRRPNAP